MTDSSRYTPELAAEICRRVSEGEPLRQVCRDPGMPPESTVRGWTRSNNNFAAQYAQARAMCIDAWSDELVTVAYRSDLDPGDKRVITENLRWLLSKLAPTRFGDRLLLASDPSNPVEHLHKQVSLDHLTVDQLNALESCSMRLLESRRADQEAVDG